MHAYPAAPSSSNCSGTPSPFNRWHRLRVGTCEPQRTDVRKIGNRLVNFKIRARSED